ncbi:MAG: hypothetical protein R3C49_11960 [Planctomycetaceae bacterium]
MRVEKGGVFEKGWLRNKYQFIPKETPPVKRSTRKINSETVSPVIDSDMASDGGVSHEARDLLSEILREGARKMLEAAIHREFEDYLQERSKLLDEHGRRRSAGNARQGCERAFSRHPFFETQIGVIDR